MTNQKVSWLEVSIIIQGILIFALFKELSSINSWISLIWFINHDGIIIQVECDDEFSLSIFRSGIFEFSNELQVILVVHPLIVILIGGLTQKPIAMAEGIFFTAKSIVGRRNIFNFRLWLWQFNLSKWEFVIILLLVVILSKFITSHNKESSAKDIKISSISNIIRADKIVLNRQSRLVKSESLWQSSSLHHQSKAIFTRVSIVDFSDFNSIISKIVMQDVIITALTEESQNLSVILQELFLALLSSTSKLAFQVFF